ncbi:hypothetical protein [Halocynthiibacter styelae]|uniref:Uncharacterized protein n=1 Tax=Halocynthiibacter styelae TaxID=2761955 RepID=A0A8J7IQG2_9RHOB|nr:hypothetical protein [Paenihalocynthiibacter styelae]MBI1493431.1 hypothetical protein [Paenihalocynthiibacter styelae]
MKLKSKLTLTLLTALAVSGCVKPEGDFCDIAKPIWFERTVAVFIVREDRKAAEVIDSQNRYGEQACGWPR